MNVADIFQAIEETKFLQRLSSQHKLFFIGEHEPLEYIQRFLHSQRDVAQDFFYDLSLHPLEDIANKPIEQYRAIIIVSLKEESKLNKSVSQNIQSTSKVPVLNLFEDVFINHACRRPLLRRIESENNLTPLTSYGIITTPRSGSTYLCDLLESTNLAGHPREHLRLAVQELARYCNFDYLKLLNQLQSHSASKNEVFGTKLISHFLFELKRTKPDFSQVFASLDKFILLVRKDKIAQAISLVIAQQTEVWHLQNNASTQNYQSKLDNIQIDDDLLDNITHKYDFIQKQEARLKKILAAHDIVPLTIFYEDILDNTEQQIRNILEFLSIDLSSDQRLELSSGVKRMPSRISQEIRRQYDQKKALSVN